MANHIHARRQPGFFRNWANDCYLTKYRAKAKDAYVEALKEEDRERKLEECYQHGRGLAKMWVACNKKKAEKVVAKPEVTKTEQTAQDLSKALLPIALFVGPLFIGLGALVAKIS